MVIPYFSDFSHLSSGWKDGSCDKHCYLRCQDVLTWLYVSRLLWFLYARRHEVMSQVIHTLTYFNPLHTLRMHKSILYVF